jgi:hypothetical protein
MKTTADKTPWEIVRKKRGGVAGAEPPQRGVALSRYRLWAYIAGGTPAEGGGPQQRAGQGGGFPPKIR